MLAVSLAIAVNHFEGPFFDVEGFKGLCSIPSIVCGIRLIFLALSLRQHEPAFILDGFLACDRHAKPDCLFPALYEPALAVPVLQRRNRPYWNSAERALN